MDNKRLSTVLVTVLMVVVAIIGFSSYARNKAKGHPMRSSLLPVCVLLVVLLAVTYAFLPVLFASA